MQPNFGRELIVDGTILQSCGLGMSLRRILLGLEQRGNRVRIENRFGEAGFMDVGEWTRLLALRDTAVSESAPLLVRGPIGFSMLQRNIRRRGRERYTIFQTVTEVSELNASVRHEAEYADEIWVPTDFDLDKFRKIHPRAHKINYFTDPTRYHPGVRPHAELRPRCRGFVFLFSGAGIYRKGLMEACRAYGAAFTARDDVSFLILSKEAREEDVRACLKGPREDHPHFVLVNRYLHETEMPSAYACADALLLPSRAEGWSHPAMEFACMGKPSIMTDYGGQLEFLDPSGAWLVPVKKFGRDPAMSRLSTAQYKGVTFPVLDEAFVARLTEALREAYHRPEVTRKKGTLIQAHVSRNFTAAKTLAAVEARLEAIAADLQANGLPWNPLKHNLCAGALP